MSPRLVCSVAVAVCMELVTFPSLPLAAFRSESTRSERLSAPVPTVWWQAWGFPALLAFSFQRGTSMTFRTDARLTPRQRLGRGLAHTAAGPVDIARGTVGLSAQ